MNELKRWDFHFIGLLFFLLWSPQTGYYFMVWVPEALCLNLIWRWEFVIPVEGKGKAKISGRPFIALHTLHLVGQFIALHTALRCFILSPEFCRHMAASVGAEAAPHLMELSRPNPTLTVEENLGGKTSFSEVTQWNFNKNQNLFFILSLSQKRIYWSLGFRLSSRSRCYSLEP